MVVVAILAGCGRHGRAQPPPAAPSSQPELAEATRLDQLVEKLDGEGRYQEAIPYAERSLAIRENNPGPVHADVAKSLNNLAVIYNDQGAFDKAEPLYVRALNIREQALGPMHPDVAESLSNLASLYKDQGAYDKAEPLLVRALDICEKAHETIQLNTATILNNLSEVYRSQGVYDKAEPLIVRALDIFEKVLGPMHPNVAVCLNNLAGIHQAQGAYNKAEPLLVRALDIFEKVFGPMHPNVAQGLNNVAVLHEERGAYAQAEPLLVRALDIREKVFGPRHAAVAESLNNLAVLYELQGAYGKAEPFLIRVLDIFEHTLGPMHVSVATALNNLAGVYRAQGAYAQAEPLLVRALDITEKALGRTHPAVAQRLTSLAAIHQDQRDYAKAEPLLLRALGISELRGPTHTDVALSLNNLAALYWAKHAYAKAESMYIRALDIYEKALGPAHPIVATVLNNLAGLDWARGALRTAEPLMARAAEVREAQLRVDLASVPEPRKRALMTLVQGETDSLVSLQADALPNSDGARSLALTTVLRRKGRILDSLIDGETRLRAHLTPPLRAQLDQLNRARTQLAARQYSFTGTPDRTAIAAARARVDELEANLSKVSAEFGAQSEAITVAQIQAALPPRAALVEIVRYRHFDPRQMPRIWGEQRYGAYLVTRHGPPRWVALGKAAPIDAEVDAVRTAMDREVPIETTKAALRRLDALVLAPVRDRLSSVSHMILAPDGKLNLVPFEALVDPSGHHALENYLVSYLTSGRDLLRLAAPHEPRSPAVIVDSPDYGTPPSRKVPGSMWFESLPAASKEAAVLERYFPTELTGQKATRSALAALTGPAMLHIATHGFYTRDPGPTSTALASTMLPAAAAPGLLLVGSTWLAERGIVLDSVAPSLLSPPDSGDPADALDRVGLAMAGANQGADGIVTGREIAGFDWWGTRLVVLSACETGVGAVTSGDGVYGLRRALVLAGAESQVVSLWSIRDASMPALMQDYYDELARGTGRAEALRRAKLHMMRQPDQAHPYYWAPFIAAGDWRPLDERTMPRPGRGP